MKYIVSILTIVVFSAFAKAQQDSIKVEVPIIVFKAKYGETIKQGDVSIKLLDVLEDSRCPSGVQCVWAGQVKLLVEVIDNDKKETKEITLKGNNKPEIFKNEHSTIYLKEIQPGRIHKVKQVIDDYVLLLEKVD